MKKWLMRRSKINIEHMAKALGVDEIIATILANRHVKTKRQAITFLEPSLELLGDSYEMKDMEKAIKRTREALENNQKITVFGDYDADGVTSTVITYKTLKELGGVVSYHIPHRQKDGYGLNMSAIDEVHRMGTDLLITCDNGIASVEEIKKANELGIDVIIIDHHEPIIVFEGDKKIEVLPPAYAIVDPKQSQCLYDFKNLCAGGLAYKFSKALTESYGQKFDTNNEKIIFAAIATICDIVDLVGENRVIAFEGLKHILSTPNKGLKKLIEKTGLEDKSISEYHIGFIIGPNINATGRLESAKMAVELFITDNENRIEELVNELVSLNEERKEMTENATKQVIETIESGENNNNVIVIYNEFIHESIAGIVAGRVKERYYKPTIVITKSESVAKGSARSIEGYNIFEELSKVKELFVRFGGHPMAAGLSIEEKNIDVLRAKLNENEQMTQDILTPSMRIEKQLDLSQIRLDLIKEVGRLAPFGKANNTPIFGSKNVIVKKINILGKNNNVLKLMLKSSDTGAMITGISFDMCLDFIEEIKSLYGEEKCSKMLNGEEEVSLDILYTLSINEYMGKETPQIIMKDYRIL